MKIRIVLMWGLGLIVLGLVSLSILQQENVLANGRVILAPIQAPNEWEVNAESSSISLRYEEPLSANTIPEGEAPRLVVSLDDRNRIIATRKDDGAPLQPTEAYLKLRKPGDPYPNPSSFSFTKGKGETLSTARYVELHASPDGSTFAIRLYDKDLNPLKPEFQR